MIRRPRLLTHRSIRLGALALAGLGALSSCSTVTSDAARVDGASISTADFEDVLSGIGEANETVLLPSGAYDAASARNLLTAWITTEVLRADLDERGIEITAEDRAETAAQLATDPSWADLSSEVQEFFVDVNTVQSVFNRESGTPEAELQAAYEQGPATVGVACVRALIVATEGEATAALDRIQAGEAFADVAAEVSLDATAADGGALTDPNSGLPCLTWETFSAGALPELVDPLAGASVGETVGPIVVPAGAVLLEVRPFDEVAEAVQTLVGGSAAVEAQTELVLAAEPYVAARYGRWDPLNGAVVELG